MMRGFALTLLAGTIAISGASASPLAIDRFVHEKSGYVVETREVGSWLKVTGRHPQTGKTFALKVARSGRVSGVWEGRPVAFRVGETPPPVELAAAGAGAK